MMEGKRLFLLVVLLCLFVGSPVVAENNSNLETVQGLRSSNDTPIVGSVIEMRPPLRNDELDEYQGDTVILGFTDYEDQHNSTVGRNLQFNPVLEQVYGAWDWYDNELNTRVVGYQRISDVFGLPVRDGEDGYTPCSAPTSGFPVVAQGPVMESTWQYPVFDMRPAGDVRHMGTASELDILPGVFNDYAVPNPGEEVEWIQAAAAGDSILHIIGSNRDTENFYYARLSHNPSTNVFSILNDGGEPEMICGHVDFPSYDIACSPDGQRVAIGVVMPRYHLGLADLEQDNDQDYIVWISEDRGVTWDFGLSSAINVTQFQGPDLSLLPDTLAANQDTLRPWLDSHIYFDHENILHAAFSASQYYVIENSGLVYSQIFYWNDVDQYFVRVADGSHWNNWVSGVGTNCVIAQRPNMYRDPDTGWLWMVYQQFGLPGDTTAAGEPYDVSTNGYPCADLWVTASPMEADGREGNVNGKLWFRGVNITQTRTESTSIPAGECRHERDPGISLNNDGDYLHFFFSLDLDAGVAFFSEGEYTHNPMVYLQVAKQDLVDRFYENEEWIPGMPMHVNGDGYWEDPADWAWIEGDAPESGNADLPNDFCFESVYPNPFNAMTSIQFQVETPGNLKVKVYSVEGREVATLLNRSMNAGSHEITWHGADLASGIYFVSLERGSQRITQKIVLLK